VLFPGLLFPGIAVVAAFVVGLFVDERSKLAVIPLPPWGQLLVAAVLLGAIGGLVAYLSEDVRSVPLLIGAAVLLALVVPAGHLGNVVRDKVSPTWRQ
jgi:ABC-type uncharacterized transport system permease subunit